MDVIIIGAGKVGYTLAKYLSKEKDNITIIDNNLEVLNRITEHLDVMGVKGNGTSLKVLMEAGIKTANVVISVTNSDEVNMLCSLAAKKLGVKYTVARVRTPEYSEEIGLLKDELGIDLIINPEKEAALEITKRLKFPAVCSVDSFSNGKVDLVGFNVTEGDKLDGKRISDINLLKGKVLLVGVERGEEVFIPTGEFVVHKDDKVYVIGEHSDVESFFKSLGKYQSKVKNAMIVGGGRISYYLVKRISELGINCKIIEKDFEKCKSLNEHLPNAVIINGDGTDHELLLSESLEETDAFITLTGRDEENIIAALFAANSNIKNVITKVTRYNYDEIAKRIGIDSVISPKTVTANKILKYIRPIKNNQCCSIEKIYKIFHEKAEAVEFSISESTKFVNTQLKDIKFRDDVLVSTIVRDNNIIIPTGNDVMKLGDRVIIITKSEALMDINHIFLGGGK